MRIAYLSVSDQLGGSENVLLEMIAGVRRLRPAWPVHLILPGRGPLLNKAEAAGADCIIVPLPRALSRLGESGPEDAGRMASRLRFSARLLAAGATVPGYVRRLRRFIDASRPDVLHSNGLKGHIAGARAARDAKVVWHIHDYVGSRRTTSRLLQAHKSRVAAILANSSSTAEDVTRTLEPTQPVRVLHNAIDLDVFSPSGSAEDLDRQAGLPPQKGTVVRIGLVATFARWKGHEVFLRALAALPAEYQVRGYVIGAPLYDTDGSECAAADLQALADRLGLRDRVAFTGFLRPAPAMRALDIVVHASTKPEPFGLVIAEAMACGRAVIVSAAGGAAELVTDEADALTHTPGDVEGLTRALARLVADPVLRQHLGLRARETACRRFGSDRLAQEIVAIYEQIAG